MLILLPLRKERHSRQCLVKESTTDKVTLFHAWTFFIVVDNY